VRGVERGMRLIGSLPQYEAVIIDAEGRVFHSAGLGTD
jgi:hypothetical protein